MLQLYCGRRERFCENNAALSPNQGKSPAASSPSFPSRSEDHRDARRSEASWRNHRDAQRAARALLVEPASAPLVLLPNMAQSVNITELNLPQLEMLKNQLDQVGTGGRDTPFPPHMPPAHASSLAPPIPPLFGRLPFPCETLIPSQDRRLSGSASLSLHPPTPTLFPVLCRKWSSCPRPLPSSRWYRPSMWKPRTV